MDTASNYTHEVETIAGSIGATEAVAYTRRQAIERRWASTVEAATLLETSKTNIYRMIRAGQLTGRKINREYRIPLAELAGLPGYRPKTPDCASSAISAAP